MIILRLTLSAHLMILLVQAVFAGQFLSGEDHSVAFHEVAGQLAAVLGLLQILVIAIARVPRRNLVSFLVSSILIFLGEALQIGTGYGRFLSVHIPLGVLIFGGVAAQLVGSLR